MRDGDDRSGVLLQVFLQPLHRFGVEMIRRFVEKKDVRLLEQQAAQRDPPLLAAGKDGHRRLAGRASQRVHGHLQFGIEIPGAGGVELILHLGLTLHQFVHVGVGIGERVVDLVELFQQVDDRLHALLDDLPNRLRFVELRLLLQEADGVTRRDHRLAEKVFVFVGQDSEE